MNSTQLIQQGYMYVATFNHKDRAEARAAFHRKQGHEARVTEDVYSFGVKVYSVYIKLQEV